MTAEEEKKFRRREQTRYRNIFSNILKHFRRHIKSSPKIKAEIETCISQHDLKFIDPETFLTKFENSFKDDLNLSQAYHMQRHTIKVYLVFAASFQFPEEYDSVY